MTTTPADFEANTPEYWDAVYAEEIKEGHTRIYVHLYNMCLGSIPNKAKVFDFGCGTGFFLKWLKKERPESILKGVDYSQQAIAIAKENCKENEYAVDNKISGGLYDVITCIHVLEHFTNPDYYIEQAYDNLTDNGTLILVFPTYDHPWHEHVRIWTLDYLRLFMKQQKKWNFIMIHRPRTGFHHENGENIEETIVVCQKAKK